jgi:hypothetical protein
MTARTLLAQATVFGSDASRRPPAFVVRVDEFPLGGFPSTLHRLGDDSRRDQPCGLIVRAIEVRERERHSLAKLDTRALKLDQSVRAEIDHTVVTVTAAVVEVSGDSWFRRPAVTLPPARRSFRNSGAAVRLHARALIGAA